ncbi:MAG: hypothetical protein QN198_04495 [Armatimonadota bacterium]|nr:hypothetical protein [Armatimonadota bacterium]MDR5702843.1 hypothetical protein [Armatimonadota bacterium]MDR7435065.1 hypothetical protein [Armatimonadota bacterium]
MTQGKLLGLILVLSAIVAAASGAIVYGEFSRKQLVVGASLGIIFLAYGLILIILRKGRWIQE